MSLEGGEQTPPAPPGAAPATAPQTPGALLQQERVRRGLSLQQAAEGLHLDAWIIDAIESNHFLALGAPVYAKGYLRKYAALLELAPDVIVTRYEALSDTPVVPTPVPVITTTPPPRPKWPKYVGWTLLIAIVVGIGLLAYKLVMPHLAPAPAASAPVPSVPASQTEPASQTAIVPSPVVDESRQVAIPETKPVEVAQERPPAREVVPMPAPTSTAATGPAPDRSPSAASAGAQERPLQVRLEFSEASWIEVYDAAGQRLLYEVGQPGRPRMVSGVAPLNVVVGLASAVDVQVNERAIVVPRRANKDSTRFTISADGAVQ